jgi:hypothetical protein
MKLYLNFLFIFMVAAEFTTSDNVNAWATLLLGHKLPLNIRALVFIKNEHFG